MMDLDNLFEKDHASTGERQKAKEVCSGQWAVGSISR
jgi:hypothetical protein